MIYLDHNATTPLAPEVKAALTEALDTFGNPSSLHAHGQAARRCLDRARGQVARLIGARPEEIFFTSGATEANVWALGEAAKRGRLCLSALEHSSISEAASRLHQRGVEVVTLGVDEAGRLCQEALQAALVGASALFAINLASHELGVLAPVEAMAPAIHQVGGWLHVDAVQAAGKVPLQVDQLGADSLTLTAHKLYGPKGVGALFVRSGRRLPALLPGTQERGQRAGTENVLGAVGFGAACEVAARRLAQDAQRLTTLRERLEAGLLTLRGAALYGLEAPRLSNTTLATFGLPGEAVVLQLDWRGVSVSSGAACSAGQGRPSPALLALGLPEAKAREAVRFSLGRGTTEAEVDAAVSHLADVLSSVTR